MPLLIDFEATKNLQAEIHTHLRDLLSEAQDQAELGVGQYLQLVNLLYHSTLMMLLDFAENDSDDAKEAGRCSLPLQSRPWNRLQPPTAHSPPTKMSRDAFVESRSLRRYCNQPQMKSLLTALDFDMAWQSNANFEDGVSVDEEGTQDVPTGDEN